MFDDVPKKALSLEIAQLVNDLHYDEIFFYVLEDLISYTNIILFQKLLAELAVISY